MVAEWSHIQIGALTAAGLAQLFRVAVVWVGPQSNDRAADFLGWKGKVGATEWEKPHKIVTRKSLGSFAWTR